MSDLKQIQTAAERVLQVSTSGNTVDKSLLDRTRRIVNSVHMICKLPEITESNTSIDNFCLVGASWFSYSGLAGYAQSRQTFAPVDISQANPAEMNEYAAAQVAEALEKLVPKNKIEKMIEIIEDSYDRFTSIPEAMILSDARNLDDMGSVGLFNEIRKYTLNGKGVNEFLTGWKRKIDYQYWQARLTEGFRFDTVRKIAEMRFKTAQACIEQLNAEHTAKDIEEVILESLNQVG